MVVTKVSLNLDFFVNFKIMTAWYNDVQKRASQ